MKRQLAKANSPTFAQKDSLNKKREACEKRRNVITDSIQELRLEIQQLEQEDEMIQKKMVKNNWWTLKPGERSFTATEYGVMKLVLKW